MTASLDVTNAGDRDGTEVVQLYASYPAPDQPRRRLCGFDRVTLAPGETKTARIEVPRARLALWDVAAAAMSVPPGQIELGAGASCADIRQTATLTVPGTVSGRSIGRDGKVSAADFDDYENITLVDRTREDGTVVTPANPAGRSWLVFKSVCSERTVAAVFRVACPRPWWRADSGADRGRGQPGRQRRRALDRRSLRVDRRHASLTLADGTSDLYLDLDGAVRLDWFRLERE